MNERYKPNPPIIRSLLRECDDGMSVNEIEAKTGIDQDQVRKCLNKMPDAYIDRWVYLHSNPTAIWCVVVIPENCPRPKRTKESVKCQNSPRGATKTLPSLQKSPTPE
jgi:hypothetical protein